MEWRIFFPYDDKLLSRFQNVLKIDDNLSLNDNERIDECLISPSCFNLKLRHQKALEVKTEILLSPSCYQIVPGIQRWKKYTKFKKKKKEKEIIGERCLPESALNHQEGSIGSLVVEHLLAFELIFRKISQSNFQTNDIIDAINDGRLVSLQKNRIKKKLETYDCDLSIVKICLKDTTTTTRTTTTTTTTNNSSSSSSSSDERTALDFPSLWISFSVESKENIWAIRDAITNILGNDFFRDYFGKYNKNGGCNNNSNQSSSSFSSGDIMQPIIGGYSTFIRAAVGLEDMQRMKDLCEQVVDMIWKANGTDSNGHTTNDPYSEFTSASITTITTSSPDSQLRAETGVGSGTLSGTLPYDHNLCCDNRDYSIGIRKRDIVDEKRDGEEDAYTSTECNVCTLS